MKSYSRQNDNSPNNEDIKQNEWSETTALSHENERQDRDSSNNSVGDKENGWQKRNNNDRGGRGRGRGRGRGGDRRGGGRGRNFNNNRNETDNGNDDDNIEIPENAFEELFIKGVNYEASEDDIRETFSKYGDIASVKILKDKETQKSKGCGFVKFEDKKSAVRALNDADNLVIKGRNIQVRFSNDKEGEFKGKKKGKDFNSGNNDKENEW